MREEVVLERDVDVTAIPYGDRISLQKGHPVIITQALGGSYTLVTMQGYMVRLDGPDADAIGKEKSGDASIDALRNDAQFVKITSQGLRESHVHDVIITKEAPNYRVE